MMKAQAKADPINAAMSVKALFTKQLAVDMGIASNVIQVSFGTVGDTAATNLAQAAKVFGGDLLHASEDAMLDIAVGDATLAAAYDIAPPAKNATNATVAQAE